MRPAVLFTVTLLSITFAARADFSYTTTSKPTGGTMVSSAGGGNTPPSKYYFKGQKMKTETGDISTIIDFDAQTLTVVNKGQRTVTVRNLGDAGAAGRSDVAVKVDVRETGQQKAINGFNAKELIMTMEVENDNPQMKQMGKMQIEMDMWLSSDVPGVGELRDFYKRNMERFPWAALSGSGNRNMSAGIAQMQRKMAEMGGVQVQSVMKMRSAGGPGAAPAMAQLNASQKAQMDIAMAKLQALQQQGGPAAAAAAQAMARMGGAPPAASNSLMEITMESSDFSTASIPDLLFEIPAGYQKVDAK